MQHGSDIYSEQNSSELKQLNAGSPHPTHIRHTSRWMLNTTSNPLTLCATLNRDRGRYQSGIGQCELLAGSYRFQTSAYERKQTVGAVRYGSIEVAHKWLLLADSVEKVAPLSGLRQNICIGQQGSTQHDGTVIEWAGSAVLLVQP